MRVIAAACSRAAVDAAGPSVGMARVVGQASDGTAQAMIAGPAEAHAARLARLVGHWHDAGLGGQPIVIGEALAHVAQLGQDLRGADAPARGKDMMICPSGSDSTKRSMRRVSSAICSTRGLSTATSARTSCASCLAGERTGQARGGAAAGVPATRPGAPAAVVLAAAKALPGGLVSRAAEPATDSAQERQERWAR